MSKVKFIFIKRYPASTYYFKLYCFRETVSLITSIGGEVLPLTLLKMLLIFRRNMSFFSIKDMLLSTTVSPI
jgi:hypothetical protein